MRKFLLLALILIAVTGCKLSHHSKIVAEVEAAGSGPLDGLDQSSIRNWFIKHSDVATKIGPECSTAAKTAKADWSNTTEGRVCAAAEYAELGFVPAQ